MVNKIQEIIISIEREKGELAAALLVKTSPELTKWTLVFSSPWLDNMATVEAINYFSTKLTQNLISSELNKIGRISVLKTYDPFIVSLTNIFNVENSTITLSDVLVGNIQIFEAILFASKKIKIMIPLSKQSQNPVSNRTINPIINRTINPIFNRTINPIFNRTINPIFNRTINPIFNRTINPIFNRTINPIFNRTINPIFNRTINPIFNRTINPIFNRAFSGFYLYSKELERLAYQVEVNDTVNLLFDSHNKLYGFTIKTPIDTYIVYDSNNNWIGSLISNSQNGFNYFNQNNEWIGFMV